MAPIHVTNDYVINNIQVNPETFNKFVDLLGKVGPLDAGVLSDNKITEAEGMVHLNNKICTGLSQANFDNLTHILNDYFPDSYLEMQGGDCNLIKSAPDKKHLTIFSNDKHTDDDVAVPVNDDGVPFETIIVYGRKSPKEAKQVVEHKLEALGYERSRHGNETIYKPKIPYYPTVVLHDDGLVELRRNVIHKPRSTGELLEHLLLPIYFFQGLLISKAKLDSLKGEVLSTINADVIAWQNLMAAEYFEGVANSLSDELMAFWNGTPDPELSNRLGVYGPEFSLSYDKKRAIILELWRSRTDTEQGFQVRQAVEGFMQAIIMSSPNPYTEEEINAANLRHAWGEPLALVRESEISTDVKVAPIENTQNAEAKAALDPSKKLYDTGEQKLKAASKYFEQAKALLAAGKPDQALKAFHRVERLDYLFNHRDNLRDRYENFLAEETARHFDVFFLAQTYYHMALIYQTQNNEVQAEKYALQAIVSYRYYNPNPDEDDSLLTNMFSHEDQAKNAVAELSEKFESSRTIGLMTGNKIAIKAEAQRNYQNHLEQFKTAVALTDVPWMLREMSEIRRLAEVAETSVPEKELDALQKQGYANGSKKKLQEALSTSMSLPARKEDVESAFDYAKKASISLESLAEDCFPFYESILKEAALDANNGNMAHFSENLQLAVLVAEKTGIPVDQNRIDELEKVAFAKSYERIMQRIEFLSKAYRLNYDEFNQIVEELKTAMQIASDGNLPQDKKQIAMVVANAWSGCFRFFLNEVVQSTMKWDSEATKLAIEGAKFIVTDCPFKTSDSELAGMIAENFYVVAYKETLKAAESLLKAEDPKRIDSVCSVLQITLYFTPKADVSKPRFEADFLPLYTEVKRLEKRYRDMGMFSASNKANELVVMANNIRF